jgi:hypothetical protein
MKHPKEEDLIAHRQGETLGREDMAAHLTECASCRAEFERIDAVLAALDSMPVPDPGEDYGRRVWREIAPRLPQRRSWDLAAWLEPRRWVTAGAMAVLVVVAFAAGLMWKREKPEIQTPAVAQVRERVLLVAVGDHLDRSEMILVELANAAPNAAGRKLVNLSAEQRRAEDLLDENRLYRQSAVQQGNVALAGVLDELERVLLDIAHSPQEATQAQLQTIQRRIEAQGILFKVRVVGMDLRDRQSNPRPAPAGNQPAIKERNKG